jgi:hypothetical protein
LNLDFVYVLLLFLLDEIANFCLSRSCLLWFRVWGCCCCSYWRNRKFLGLFVLILGKEIMLWGRWSFMCCEGLYVFWLQILEKMKRRYWRRWRGKRLILGKEYMFSF